MTEAEWLSSTEPERMIAHLRGGRRARKLSLFACACWHRLRHLFAEEASQRLLAALEAHADGGISRAELLRANDAVLGRKETAGRTAAAERERQAVKDFVITSRVSGARPGARAVALGAMLAGHRAAAYGGDWAVDAERRAQAHLLREVFGNPFRPVPLDPGWLTWNDGAVPQLAAAIYEGRRFTELPVLADALQEAGCDSDALIEHCRDAAPLAPHVRGCWALDLLLGKR